MNNLNGEENNFNFNKPQVMTPKVIASVNIGPAPTNTTETENKLSANEPNISNQDNSLKKPILIAVSAVAGFALLFILLKVLVFKGDSDDSKKADDTATVATTESNVPDETETTTEDDTTEITTTEEVTTEEVVLDGTWTDYCFMMGDEFYQLPIAYIMRLTTA